MRILFSSLLYVLPLLLCVEAAHAGESIHMLPPIPFGNTSASPPPCATGSTSGMLYWGGVNGSGNGEAINCIPGFTGDKFGNIGIPGTATFTGNVGIGGVSAAQQAYLKLYVGGVIGTTGAAAAFYAYDQNLDGSRGVFYRSGGVNYLYDSSYGNVLQYNSSGQVGIGVTPQYTLDVNRDIAINGKDIAQRDGSNAFLFPYSSGYSGNNVFLGSSGYETSLSVTGNLRIAYSNWMDAGSANTVVAIENLPACNANEALTKVGTTSFACIPVTDIQNVGTTTLPNCTSGGTFLTSNGSSFSCQAQTYPPAYWALNSSNNLYNTAGANVAISGLLGSGWRDPVIGLPSGWSGGLHTYDVYGEGSIGAGPSGGPAMAGLTSAGAIYGAKETLSGRLGTNGLDPVSGIPSGWGGGIHTWDLYAEGSVGAGPPGGPPAAYMNSSGSILAKDYCVNGVGCGRSPVPSSYVCPTGTVVTGFQNSGTPICSTPATGLPDCANAGYLNTVTANGDGSGYFCNPTCPSASGTVGDDGYYSYSTYSVTFPNGIYGQTEPPSNGPESMFIGTGNCGPTEYSLICTYTGWQVYNLVEENLTCYPDPASDTTGTL